jgi:hypothetical protein
MSNHHLRNAALSLKAKGLLSQMLSLPENWDYTLQGLAYINREKLDAIREAVRELEKAGYITRSRVRNDKGQLTGTEDVIREQPENDAPASEKPTLDNPMLGNPTLEKPTLDKPTLENPTQLNKDVQITEPKSIEKSNTELSNTDSIPFNSTQKRCEPAIAVYREIIMDNIEYPFTVQRFNKARLDEIVELILETLCSARKTIRIAGDDYPAELVKAKFLKLNSSHIEFVFECMDKCTTEIRNIKKYLLAVLFNAPNTIDSYYTARVKHDAESEGWQ